MRDLCRHPGNLFGLVPHAFKIDTPFHDGDEETQVARRGLSARDDVDATVVENAFEPIDLHLALPHRFGGFGVVRDERPRCCLHLSFDSPAHIHEAEPNGFQFAVVLSRNVSVHRRSTIWPRSTIATRDVVLRLLLRGIRENRIGVVVFDQFAEIQERSVVRYAGRLLHVVRDDHDRVVVL